MRHIEWYKYLRNVFQRTTFTNLFLMCILRSVCIAGRLTSGHSWSLRLYCFPCFDLLTLFCCCTQCQMDKMLIRWNMDIAAWKVRWKQSYAPPIQRQIFFHSIFLHWKRNIWNAFYPFKWIFLFMSWMQERLFLRKFVKCEVRSKCSGIFFRNLFASNVAIPQNMQNRGQNLRRTE